MNAVADDITAARQERDDRMAAVGELADTAWTTHRAEQTARASGSRTFRSTSAAMEWHAEAKARLQGPKGMHPRTETVGGVEMWDAAKRRWVKVNTVQARIAVDGGPRPVYDETLATIATIDKALDDLDAYAIAEDEADHQHRLEEAARKGLPTPRKRSPKLPPGDAMYAGIVAAHFAGIEGVTPPGSHHGRSGAPWTVRDLAAHHGVHEDTARAAFGKAMKRLDALLRERDVVVSHA